MATGVVCIDGSWYRYGADGRMVTGWHADGGRSYYYDPLDGTLTFRNRCVDGSWYWFDLAEGYMWTGPAYIDGAWYRYGADGRMLHGSQWLDGSWYRYDPADGRMLTGPQWIDGAWYFYDRMDGRMLMGSACIDGAWYRYDPVDGRMKHGWQSIEGSWYFYHLVDDRMLFGNQSIYGILCHFDEQAGYLTDGDIAMYPYSLEQAVQAQVRHNPSYSFAEYLESMDPRLSGEQGGGSFLFMRLDCGYSGVSADQINQYIEQNCIYRELQTQQLSSLRGMGQAVVEASRRTRVNEVYILCHAILETGWGCSPLATGNVPGYEGFYNFYGIGAYDIDPNNSGAARAKLEGWISPELAIQGGAQWIKANYIENALVMESGTTASQNTLYKMRFAPGLSNTWHQYATSLTWPHSIARLISEAYSFFGERWVPYEIPLYQQ